MSFSILKLPLLLVSLLASNRKPCMIKSRSKTNPRYLRTTLGIESASTRSSLSLQLAISSSWSSGSPKSYPCNSEFPSSNPQNLNPRTMNLLRKILPKWLVQMQVDQQPLRWRLEWPLEWLNWKLSFGDMAMPCSTTCEAWGQSRDNQRWIDFCFWPSQVVTFCRQLKIRIKVHDWVMTSPREKREPQVIILVMRGYLVRRRL